VDSTGTVVAEQRRRLALLVLIASTRELGVSRDKLIASLSPESPTDSARPALHQQLYYLREQIGDDAFLAPIRYRTATSSRSAASAFAATARPSASPASMSNR
jgi:DNA-binding SARP family transcriptional activator